MMSETHEEYCERMVLIYNRIKTMRDELASMDEHVDGTILLALDSTASAAYKKIVERVQIIGTQKYFPSKA